MSDHIPPEVLSEILAKLSIEDIVRCTAVCKSWYSLITSSAFLSLQTQRIASIATQNSLLLVRNYKTLQYSQIKDDSFSLHFNDDTLSEYKSLDFSFDPQITNFRVIDCINGVICLSHDDDLILWNPSIRKCLRLPQPLQPFDPDDDSVGTQLHSIGFGFNSVTSDFKVVRVLDYWGNEGPYHVQVYESKVGSWRNIDPKGLRAAIYRFSNQVFFRGAVHWIGTNWNEEEVNTIVSFDIQSEVFAEMSLPDCVADRDLAWNLRVSVMGESLSLIYHKLGDDDDDICSVWVMKQYGVAGSWTKQFSIDIGTEIHPWEIFGFRRNGEVLLAESEGGALFCYDPDKEHAKSLRLFEREKFEVVNFMESVALLGVKEGKIAMKMEAEDKVMICKGSSPDVHVEKKMKIESQYALVIG